MSGQGYTSIGDEQPEKRKPREASHGQISLVAGRVKTKDGDVAVGIGLRGLRDALLANMGHVNDEAESVQMIALSAEDAREFAEGILDVIRKLED
jgi:hypothetical protein